MRGARGDGPRRRALHRETTVLIEIVTRHIKDEEQNWFPEVRKGLGRKQLQDIGAPMC